MSCLENWKRAFQGTGGVLLGLLMNLGDTNRYLRILDHLSFSSGEHLLDIGCGGGAFIDRITERFPGLKAWGMDPSEAMVRASRYVTGKKINRKIVTVQEGKASVLPFPDNYFDYVTALETIQYWDKLAISLAEVWRVLKPGARFLIINRYPKPGSLWYNRIPIQSASAYQKVLSTASFREIRVDTEGAPGWIFIEARK